jgi:hypothetical protein
MFILDMCLFVFVPDFVFVVDICCFLVHFGFLFILGVQVYGIGCVETWWLGHEASPC